MLSEYFDSIFFLKPDLKTVLSDNEDLVALALLNVHKQKIPIKFNKK